MLQIDYNHFLNQYYNWNQRFLYVLGLWPTQSRKEQVFRICTAAFFQIPPLVHQLYLLLTKNFEMEWFCNTLQLIIPALCFLSCYYTTAFGFVKVNILYSQLKFDIQHISDEKEFTIVRRYAIQSKWCTMVFMFIIYFYGVAMLSPSLLNVILYFLGLLDGTQLTLPIPVSSILNPGVLYYTILFYEALVIYIMTTTALSNLAAYILLVQHACSQFTVITMKIHEPFEKNNWNIRYTWYDSTPLDEYNWIIDIVKRYGRATELIHNKYFTLVVNSNLAKFIFPFCPRFVNMTNSISENIYLVEIILGLFLIMLNFIYMLQFSVIMQNKKEAILCSFYIFGSMFIIYLNFYVGQRLLDHSNKVFMELCHVPFYRISTKSQKLLLFLMMRSMKPCSLSIGGMFISSHGFFASLMQKGVSYAMTCYTMR